ncbi:lariat debranching enzyme, C-terminal domain-containing protein [Sphaerosporella brunnea]|uniref:Lariat debranching enzyme, C-terminal domain-containing protein n=1 Tax=Sphaerosporella brunnea TaxID=1250544 RepID=A0A5J5EF01_9PEZI|nr:lariat debranching enzyme, C-terminal domain-containing protein [Sphaerosporella brunnea]
MPPQRNEQGLRVAVEGCGHGQLHVIYDAIQKAQEENDFMVDLLIVCGDFQAMRNLTDLEVMSCPAKYREIGDFHEYYSGKRVAPVLTLFIGGNHEASSHGAELFHGGWAAPNIYYLGAAGVVQVGNLRIGGLSGIYKSHDYSKPHNERLPYYPNEIKSIYHVRSYDVFKLHQIQEPVDVMLSHDWPANIEHYGDKHRLFRFKPHFRSDSEKGELGNPPAEGLLKRIKPKYWFSGHMHCKFEAIVRHDGEGKQVEMKPAAVPAARNLDELDLGLESSATAPSKNPDELDLELDDAVENTAPVALKNPDEIDVGLDVVTESELQPTAASNSEEIVLGMEDIPETAPPLPPTQDGPSPTTNTATRFLALDKALPNRDFLQILNIPFSRPLPDNRSRTGLYYDSEFLAITRFMNAYPGNNADVVNSIKDLPPPDVAAGIAKEREWVEANIVAQGKLQIPQNFEITAPPYRPGEKPEPQPRPYISPQTRAFCELLQMQDWVAQSEEEWETKKERLRTHPPTRFEGRGGFGGGRGGGRGGGGWRGGRGGRRG